MWQLKHVAMSWHAFAAPFGVALIATFVAATLKLWFPPEPSSADVHVFVSSPAASRLSHLLDWLVTDPQVVKTLKLLAGAFKVPKTSLDVRFAPERSSLFPDRSRWAHARASRQNLRLLPEPEPLPETLHSAS